MPHEIWTKEEVEAIQVRYDSCKGSLGSFGSTVPQASAQGLPSNVDVHRAREGSLGYHSR